MPQLQRHQRRVLLGILVVEAAAVGLLFIIASFHK